VNRVFPLFMQHRKLVGTVAPAVVTDSKQVLDTASETGKISSLQGSKPSPSPEHGRDEASSDESTARSVAVTDTASPPCGEASMEPGTKSSPQRLTEVPPASTNGTAVPSTGSTPGTEAAPTGTRPWTRWEEVFEEDLKSLTKIFAVNEELAQKTYWEILLVPKSLLKKKSLMRLASPRDNKHHACFHKWCWCGMENFVFCAGYETHSEKIRLRDD
jgi:hypothetical protein